jgi:hypothetical protein
VPTIKKFKEYNTSIPISMFILFVGGAWTKSSSSIAYRRNVYSHNFFKIVYILYYILYIILL